MLSTESCCLVGKKAFEICVVEERLAVQGTDQAARAISTARLRKLLFLHLQPINLLVSKGPSGSLRSGKIRLEGGFPLRCFQRFSGPDIATRRCGDGKKSAATYSPGRLPSEYHRRRRAYLLFSEWEEVFPRRCDRRTCQGRRSTRTLKTP